ncbi:hypothetical protein IAE37_001157 [Pseudomonas sp. S31]|uniref:GAF domain-containing protein n=1 Tax=Pseudomonas sp. S31 TaxID=1564473 RepID=UPI001913B469|nr:GAF domain-containing protein [Pseudomonas sp. S31]MBK4998881.1 hypothetical protein [Pseudomonas sp. S31]
MSTDATNAPSSPLVDNSSEPPQKKRRFFASAWGSFFLAFASVFSAAFISVCSTPILTQLEALSERNFEVSYKHSLWALGLSIVALWMVYRRERALSAVTDEKEAELHRQSQVLQERLRLQNHEMEGRLTHLPPRQFIHEYVETQANIGQLRRLSKTETNITRDKIVERMQSMLDSILALTRLWDGVSGTNKHVAYQANIMSVFSRDEVALDILVLPQQLPGREEKAPDEVEPSASDAASQPMSAAGEETTADQVQSNPMPAGPRRASRFTKEVWFMHDHFFLHNQNYDVALERCSGILFLEDELTAASMGCDAPKSGLEQVCMPYTDDLIFDDDYHHPNLPGAPRVAASGQPEYISSTSTVVKEWVNRQRDEVREFNGRYEQKIMQYYRNLEHAKSILSMPILHNDELIGVLNVSRNAEHMLLNADRAEQFAHFMAPVCYHLGKMLALLQTTDIPDAPTGG